MSDSSVLKNEEKKSDKNAFLIQRVMAYLVDILIISFVVSLITFPFVNMEASQKYTDEINELSEKILNEPEKAETYFLQYTDVHYKMAKNNGVLSIATIFMSVLYFVVYQIYNDGQTLGKKLLKIKVVSKNGDLTMNQMILRSMLADSILFDLIAFTLLLFATKSVYFYLAVAVGFIELLVYFVSLLMVMYRKDRCAIHDLLAHTNVIRI